MRIVVIGKTGTIGKAVVDALAEKHEVVGVSRSGEPRVDITDPASIRAMYEAVGQVDSVVCCAGDAAFGPLAELDDAGFETSLRSKLMGQVNLVRFGYEHVRDGGSFTLTSGIFSQKPWPGVPAIAMVNGGVESFARAAALDLDRGLRINVVAPPFIEETAAKMGMADKGQLSAAENAKAYVALIEGDQTGQVVFPGA